MIAFLGTGMLGSGFVRALRRRGEEVRVWNRTAEKARRLEQYGARAFDDPAEAARGVERVHVILSDDDAVDRILERAQLAPGVVIVDHTTTTATGALARSRRWPTFVHAPVFMGPQHTLESTGIMLVSGERRRVEPLKPALAQMTGKLVDLGDRPDAAASFKLMGNLMLMFITAGLTDMLALAKALHVPPAEAATLIDHFNPAMTLPARLERMAAARFDDPAWELSMARKDARLMMEEASLSGVSLGALPAIAAMMDAAIARGDGAADWTVLAKDVV